jgi:hypothetical protein
VRDEDTNHQHNKHMNIITKSIASLLAAVAVSTTVLAETFPVFEDTAGSPATRVIKKAAGTAATLPVNAISPSAARATAPAR